MGKSTIAVKVCLCSIDSNGLGELPHCLVGKAFLVQANSQIVVAEGIVRLNGKCVPVVPYRPIDLPQLIKGKASVEDGLEVAWIQLNSLVVALYGLFEVLLLASLPAVTVVHICLP